MPNKHFSIIHKMSTILWQRINNHEVKQLVLQLKCPPDGSREQHLITFLCNPKMHSRWEQKIYIHDGMHLGIIPTREQHKIFMMI